MILLSAELIHKKAMIGLFSTNDDFSSHRGSSGINNGTFAADESKCAPDNDKSGVPSDEIEKVRSSILSCMVFVLPSFGCAVESLLRCDITVSSRKVQISWMAIIL